MVIRQLRLDPTTCAGHGLCADLLPERIGLDEWGFPVIFGDVPPGLTAHARRAVRACPVLALRLTRVPSGAGWGRNASGRGQGTPPGVAPAPAARCRQRRGATTAGH